MVPVRFRALELAAVFAAVRCCMFFAPAASTGSVCRIVVAIDAGRGRPGVRIAVHKKSSGKTTILFALKVGHPVKTIPTVGFNLEEITVQGIKLTIWDCGGQEKVRRSRQPCSFSGRNSGGRRRLGAL
jgi:hypothetical protein